MIKTPYLQSGCPLASHLNSIGARTTLIGKNSKTKKKSVGRCFFFIYWTGQSEREEFIILLLRVRLYFTFGYVRSQKLVAYFRPERFSVNWGKKFWLELTQMKLEHKKKWYHLEPGNRTYLELSCKFYRFAPFILTNTLEKSKHSLTENLLALFPWRAW